MTGPYADAAATYLDGGFYPIPLPIGEKSPPPTGFTGYLGACVTAEDVARWSKGRRNVGLRLPEIVLGIDVDNYDGKSGGATFRATEERLGALPPTWRSTSRPADRVSGIRLYRVPPGRSWADEVGPNVEVIHHGHRFAVAAPSLHPEGRTYGWFNPDGLPDEFPRVADLPDLPKAWVAELDRGSVTDRTAKVDLKEGDVGRWLEALPAGGPCRALAGELDAAENDFSGDGSRHGIALRHVLRIVRHGEQGHVGAHAALDTLESMWLAALSHREPGHGEWERMVSGAVGMALGSPTADADRGCCSDPADDFAVETGDPNDELHDLLSILDPDRPPRRWLWEDVIPAGDAASIIAPGGTGKSLLVLALCMALVSGKPDFIGRKLDFDGRILYLDRENSEDDWAERLTDLGWTRSRSRRSTRTGSSLWA